MSERRVIGAPLDTGMLGRSTVALRQHSTCGPIPPTGGRRAPTSGWPRGPAPGPACLLALSQTNDPVRADVEREGRRLGDDHAIAAGAERDRADCRREAWHRLPVPNAVREERCSIADD